MSGLLIIFGAAALVVAIIILRPVLKRWRRRRIRALELPAPIRKRLSVNLAVYRRLPQDLRRRVDGQLQVFLAEKTFVGCQGLELTEDMELNIAAQAALLVASREDCYDDLATVLVYPSAFVTRHEVEDEHGVVTEEERELAGESWERGQVVISWDDALRGAADLDDGTNVVFHEFAHQLDHLDGLTDGAPHFRSRSLAERWPTVMQAAWETHHRRMVAGETDVLDDYAGYDPAEFFAVATEYFIERPDEVRNAYPELYDVFCNYFGLDPNSWSRAGRHDEEVK